MSFGTALKQAREAQGLTTQDVAQRTKIRGDYLRALEDGQTNLLPERTFARSYLQRYARELNLDPQPLLEEFDRTVPVAPEIAQGMRHLNGQRDARTRSGSPAGLAALFTALIVIGVGGYWAYQTFIKPKPSVSVPVTPPVTTTPDTTAVTSPPPAQPELIRTVNLTMDSIPTGARVYLDNRDLGLTPIRSFPVDARDQAELRVEYTGRQPLKQTVSLNQGRNLRARLLPPGQGASQLIDLNAPKPATTVPTTPAATATPTPTTPAPALTAVSVTFTGESWTRVTDANGRVLYQGTPPVGSKKGFPAGVTIRSGNAGGVEVSVNGAPAQPMGQSGQVLTRTY